jgi:hypothetical protein
MIPMIASRSGSFIRVLLHEEDMAAAPGFGRLSWDEPMASET